MKQGLHLAMRQQLAMTPQLKQAIKLLQLSQLELQTELQSAMDANPLLEMACLETSSDAGNKPSTASDVPKSDIYADGNPFTEKTLDPKAHEKSAVENAETAKVDQGIADQDTAFFESASYQNSDWSSVSNVRTKATTTAADEINYDQFVGQSVDLVEHVRESLRHCRLSSRDILIADWIADALDDRGYLTLNAGEIADELTEAAVKAGADLDEAYVSEAEVEVVRHLVQQISPMGLASYDMMDCLQVQINARVEQAERDPHNAASDGTQQHATVILKLLNHAAREDFLKRRDLTPQKMASLLKCDPVDLQAAIQWMRQVTDLSPGLRFSTESESYIAPDVYVIYDEYRKSFVAKLSREANPNLQLNSIYVKMAPSVKSSEDSAYLKEKIQEAKWFVKSVQSRHETLWRVANEIVKKQQAFFSEGDMAMKPMILQDVADALDLHESTISRVTANKYMQTPNGLFEMKHFFSSGLSATSGENVSSTAIRAHITEWIENEPPKKPLSDQVMAEKLSELGIPVARRTVAKYRESLGIASSSERKKQHFAW